MHLEDSLLKLLIAISLYWAKIDNIFANPLTLEENY